jgi:Transglycosylase SLT domain
MRLPTVRRRSLPAAVTGGLAAVGAVAATALSLAGGHSAPGGALSGQARAVMAVSAAPGGTASGAGTGPDGAGSAAPAGGTPGSGASNLAGVTPTRLVVPDVIASVPGGVSAADLARLSRLGGVRAVLAVDGARIRVNGVELTVLAAPAAALRPWTPPDTAASQRTWSAFQAGELITTAAAAQQARLTGGGSYPVAAAVAARVTDGGTALLGVSGVDGVVSQAEGARLGLVKNVAVLVNAPAANVTALVGQVQAALGSGARVIRLVPVTAPTRLPVDTSVPAGRPTSYLQLFQASAAQYCQGLSWTVLAAIGQIESGDGQNAGPSTAGALGPMQFLPSTWQAWGIDGFGDTGPPDIMNPFDAVPSAARMLCADGAAAGGQGLRQAIFDYNHADWYVDEVLTLAAEYAAEY